MYTTMKNVQILIAGLKTYGVSTIVHCPGGSDYGIGRSLDADPYFTCYSAVDERSAAYIGIGLAQTLNEPVAVVVTSGGAVCNLSSGVAEAYYKRVPLVLITADRHPYLLDQYEIQKIDQTNIFDRYCKYSALLPIIKADDDAWYAHRIVSEGLLELSHHNMGPIHFNIPTVGPNGGFLAKELCEFVRIDRVTMEDDSSIWVKYAQKAKIYKRIMILLGENSFDEETKNAISEFSDSYNAIVACEHMANYHGGHKVRAYTVTESLSFSAFEKVKPDLVITVGGHVITVNIKNYLRRLAGSFDHWHVDPSGAIMDGFQSLRVVFEGSPKRVFDCLCAGSNSVNDEQYFREWNSLLSSIVWPNSKTLTNMLVARELTKKLPENCCLDLAILNSARMINLFDLPDSVEVHSNIGTLGIDGCLSTAVGRSLATDRLCFLLTGDLSFFYDMNALGIPSIGSNLRVVLLNNHGGGEFDMGLVSGEVPQLRKYITANHTHSAKGWAEECGFKYISVNQSKELDAALQAAAMPSDNSVFIEVFTSMADDSKNINDFKALNAHEDTKERLYSQVHSIAKRVLKK